jgi:hypothetical protein
VPYRARAVQSIGAAIEEALQPGKTIAVRIDSSAAEHDATDELRSRVA